MEEKQVGPKDHQITRAVNELKEIAKKYGQTEQLRQRISNVVNGLVVDLRKSPKVNYNPQGIAEGDIVTYESSMLVRRELFRVVRTSPYREYSEITAFRVERLEDGSQCAILLSSLQLVCKRDFYDEELKNFTYAEYAKRLKEEKKKNAPKARIARWWNKLISDVSTTISNWKVKQP